LSAQNANLFYFNGLAVFGDRQFLPGLKIVDKALILKEINICFYVANTLYY